MVGKFVLLLPLIDLFTFNFFSKKLQKSLEDRVNKEYICIRF